MESFHPSVGCENKESLPPPVRFDTMESLPLPVGYKNKESFPSPGVLQHSESFPPLEGHTREDNPRDCLKLLLVFVQEFLRVTLFEKYH